MRWKRQHRPKDHGRVELLVTIKVNRHRIFATVLSPRSRMELWGCGSRSGYFTAGRRRRMIEQVCEDVAAALKAGGNPNWNFLRGRKTVRPMRMASKR